MAFETTEFKIENKLARLTFNRRGNINIVNTLMPEAATFVTLRCRREKIW